MPRFKLCTEIRTRQAQAIIIEARSYREAERIAEDWQDNPEHVERDHATVPSQIEVEVTDVVEM